MSHGSRYVTNIIGESSLKIRMFNNKISSIYICNMYFEILNDYSPSFLTLKKSGVKIEAKC